MLYLVFFLLQNIWAAPHPQYPQQVSLETVKASLKNEQKLKSMGPEAYKKLNELMFSESEDITTRWSATMAMAKIGGTHSLPEINQAIKSNTWFMRSAGLMALSLISEDRGEKTAIQVLQQDPALLVRASALQVVVQRANFDRQVLWGELYNPLNFKDGYSLSLRSSILKALAEKPDFKETPKFIALLREEDQHIKELAQGALENIAQLKTPGKKISAVGFWQSWWDDNSKISKN